MRVLIFVLLAAISYAQTAQAGGNQYPYNNQGYPQGGYPAGANPGNYPRPPNQGTYPNQGATYPAPNNGGQGGHQGGALSPVHGPGGRPAPKITDCTPKMEEKCRMKRIKNLCDMDICCVFEFKDRKPSCYGISEAPYNQVECQDFPRETCEKDPSCAWSMTDYECDLKWNVNGDFASECYSNPSHPDCLRHGGMITSGGILLFCVGCCCGYFLQPLWKTHEKRQKNSIAQSKSEKLGEPSWDYQQAPERPPQDYTADYTNAHRSKTPQQLPAHAYYGHNTTTSRAGEPMNGRNHNNFHAIHFEP